jgi:hypothetical protein
MRRTQLLSLIGVAGLLGVALWLWRSAPAERPASPPRGPNSPAPLRSPMVSEAPPVPDAEAAGLRILVRGDDAGVPDASVRILEPSSTRELGVCLTDGAGACEVSALRPGRVRVYVHTGRFRPKTTEPIACESGRVASVEVSLEPGRFLSGRVRSSDGQPLAGVHVGSSDEGSLLTSTDSEGRFEGGLGEEPINLFATAEGFAPKQIRGARPGSAGFDITLERPATVVGEIERGSAAAVRVGICHFDPHFAKELCIARQALEPGQSAYRFEGLPSGSYDVVVEADGFQTERESVRLEAGAMATVPHVTLRAVASP